MERAMTAPIDADLLRVLRSVDTPTICNAIEEVQGRRRNDGFTRAPVTCADPALPPIVGFARTAKIMASAPSSLTAAAQRELRIAYYSYVSSGPGPNVSVIEDVDPTPGIGAFWGEVNSAIHRGLGIAGCLTNGSFRDLAALAPGFQIIGGSVMPSHAFVHVVAIDCPVKIFGLAVRSDDLIHADRHGAVIIEADLIAEIARGIDLTTRKEAPILAAARSPGFSLERLIAAWGEADDVH
jgi:regulator of RNase E activity RraA